MEPTANRWREIDRIFAAVLEQDPAARSAFLDRACQRDPELRREVEELLDASAQAESFLEVPLVSLSGDLRPVRIPEIFPREDAAAGDRIERYRLIREIARGGMGTVYLAERADGQFEQRVALKILRRGLDTEDILARFRAERQILASLNHPNIARLLDGGATAEGRPYLVMEYVEGEPVTGYCDHHRLTVEERLRLFTAVGRAVQYAHRNLVVHRDLKPSNILVTREGRVKLLDFGIAKLLGEGADQPRTRTGLRLMTPEYASPEQVRGEPVTTASDVYQLGMLLFELLVGVRPCAKRGRSRAEVERIMAVEEPPTMSAALGQIEPGTREKIAQTRSTTPEALRRRLRGELETIVGMALRTEPERRYGSAEALVEDLEHHRTKRPISARGDSWRYRTQKFVLRNRAAVATAAAFLLLLIAYAATVTVQQAETARARDRARLALARAEKERTRAEQETEKAQQAMQFLTEIFGAGAPSSSSGLATTAGEILERGAARVDEELSDQPDVHASMLNAIGSVYQQLRAHDKAKPLLERALAIRLQLFGPEHPATAESLYELAWLHKSMGEVQKAESLYHRALGIQRQSGTDSLALALTANNLGILLQDQGRLDEAEPLYREALAIRRRHLAPEHPELATSLNSLGFLLHHRGRSEEAERFYREAVSMQRRLTGDSSFYTAAALNNLAGLLKETGRPAEAEPLYREVLGILHHHFGEEDAYVALTEGALGSILSEQGRHAEAIQLLQQSLAKSERLRPEGHANIGLAYSKLGAAYDRQGDLDRAESHLREALAIYERTRRDHYLYPLAQRSLATVLRKQGRFSEAEPLLRSSHAELREHHGGRTDDLRDVTREFVALYERWNRPEQAARYRAMLADTLPR